MKQKSIFTLAAVLLIAAFIVGAFFYKNQKTEQAAQLAAKNQTALVRADAPSFGNADAPVHIVEFFDPACGTCREFYPLVKNLMAAHPGKIRLTMRYAPFHPGSDQVVKVMEAARKQGQFQQTLEALFASQTVWVQNHTAHVDLIWSPLGTLGLDMERVKSDMNSPEIARTIAQDLADAKTMNVTMTPEYFVNGKPLPSFGFEQLQTLVDEALVNTNTK
ncbi:DSBA oxidoreductase [Rhodoferax ferrireducens T118]|uniref:DSBA oxidoreductase n=1 Tax=Albidiferax ferrireducens (strain ATCC BAA-621 / DSM 15236 / T118) TaxID=338969 RepID=Q221Y5_ALBFT|nr:thioredoxin domain-containing protein [Rhodoferax ferrireducens]ABD68168.1 DSBA oxidoreductase [Rhodoferax ferrireducens T118]